MITYQENWTGHFVSVYARTERLPRLDGFLVSLLGSKRWLLNVSLRTVLSMGKCWLAEKCHLNLTTFYRMWLKLSGLPWWRSGWESACQCRGHGFEPWSGKIPHAAERLGPWATITEPARLEPVLCNKRGRDSERPVHCDEEWPPLAATRESPHTETKTQHSHK